MTTMSTSISNVKIAAIINSKVISGSIRNCFFSSAKNNIQVSGKLVLRCYKQT